MGCAPSFLSDQKDGNILFCINFRRTRRRCSLQNGNDAIPSDDLNNSNLCNQSLLNPMQIKNESDYDKISSGKKDSIVTVAALGNLAGFNTIHTVVRRTTGSTGTSSSSGRLGHRKSSLALTPEDESMDTNNQKSVMDLKYPTVLPPNPQLKALLVFHKTDNVCDVFTTACHRQQLEVTLVKSKELALDTLQNNANMDNFHLIIIDARSSKYLDAEYITRSIRHTTGYHFTTIIAVVKKSFFDKDELPLIALLDAGVNRCISETTSVPICCTELKQILHSIVRPHNVMSTQQALYTALHRLKEVLIITDDVLRIQYANKSAERLLNMRLDEIISKPLADIFISDVSSISTQGKNIKEFDGILTVKRKGHDGIPMHVRVVPVACIGRQPTHYVFNFDVPGGQTDFIASLPQPKEAPRGSLHSIRRGSFDVRSVASDGLRRTSLAKLTSLPLEAPITKIINLLSQVQENCSADEAKLIDKVMEFLKREGLYSPQMKEIRTEDPIATDLIGALLTGPNIYSSRRSSNDSIIRTSTSRPSGILPAKMKATPLIMELLEESLSWEFDIFKLEEITEHRPLLYLGMEMFRRFDVFATFNVEENVFKTWLAVIEAHYHSQNTYHNSTHAADVMQATGAFMTQLAAKEMVMDRMDEATALIASAAHDIDHPGRSSAFLCNSNSPLAIMYNDLTVLESHHAATTFKLTLGDDKINIFKNLDKDTYKSVRSVIIDMILATEMTRHFENLAKFVSVFGADVEPKDIVQSEDDSQLLIRRMLIKVADVSNPARPLNYCVEWARRIAEEYFTQTDEEKANSLPIVMPMFDRATCSIPKSQIGFIEFIIQDMIHAWDSFIDMPHLITHMQQNYSQWKKFEEQGVHTLADIKNKQVTLSSTKGTFK
ncbi:high affinity cAMP-specific and IBMX-insensitive 3',5'-cyclic phosphodiesterase 8 isoform X3 [Episyrphus balteatus]|uniref:high affinity cAMP-specific and IBMX-insensitive 3',5'-cyclic phosphodiesterase 8 isoform X3 n=1 Tax=Episyrphus balteatus TaxID=286459 RepID=UPI002486CCB1|nr:high affinity cAMP-specific and IBMX-insensitive 3',5'-cyclic phosphodiesterase 8 isoform X3 [Episyrphus balteatus]